MDAEKIKTRMMKDTLLYMPAKAVEGIIGIFTISMYSKLFSTSMMGNYNLATITINYAFILLLGWLSQSVMRYANRYTKTSYKKVFFSTIFRVWAIVGLSSIVACTLLILPLRNYIGTMSGEFVFLTVVMFLTYSITTILFTLLGTLRIIKLNLLLAIFSVAAKLAATYIFTKLMGPDIKSAQISFILVDLVVILIIAIRMKLFSLIRPGIFSKTIYSRFTKYGIPLVWVSLTIGLLNISDRYIIKILLGSSKLGVYSLNYSISSAVFSMILLAVMRGVYPNILKAWKKNDKPQTEELLSNAVRYFLLISIPTASGLSVLSYRISKLILAPEYLAGSSIIIWVSFGMLFLGLTEYSNKAWELNSNTGKIFKNSLIACIVNIALNFILIPFFGYYAAAINTTVAYLVYFLISHYSARAVLRWKLPARTFIRIILSSLVMALAIFVVQSILPIGMLSLVATIFVGFLVYAILLVISGEISHEAALCLKWLRK